MTVIWTSVNKISQPAASSISIRCRLYSAYRNSAKQRSGH